MKKWLASVTIALVAALSATTAQAASFVIGSATVAVDDSNFWNGSVYATPSSSFPIAFDVADGGSHTFDFFKFKIADCGIICAGSAEFDATLNFLQPVMDASGSGTGMGVSLFGKLTAGALEWETQPADFRYGNDIYSVTFNDLQGLQLGKWMTATATVAHVAAVPLPAAAWLFGSALIGFGVIGRKKRVRQNAEALAA